MINKAHKQNIVLVDFPVHKQWDFLRSLETATRLHFHVKWVDGRASVPKFIRLFRYITFPIQFFLKRKRYENIISWQQFFGIMLAFYCNLFKVKKVPRIFVMTFIYKPKKGIIGTIYKKWLKYSVNNQYIDHIVVYSNHEKTFYCNELGIDPNKISFIPLSLPDISETHDDEQLKSQNYIFSTGKSNRDYDFLVNSLKGEGYNLHIACDSYHSINDPNIKVHGDIFDEKMYHYMHNCHCVVIPLKDLNVSSGQLVILQAMRLKKPIIVSNSHAIKDYVTNNVNALIINNTKEELLNALDRIYHDETLYSRLTNEGYRLFKEKHSEEAMGSAMAAIINAAHQKSI